MYNRHILELVEEGMSYEEYIATHQKPFEDLRISVITLLGTVVYDNMIPLESLDNHRYRPEIVNALKNGFGYHIGRSLQAMDEHISILQQRVNGQLSVRQFHTLLHFVSC